MLEYIKKITSLIIEKMYPFIEHASKKALKYAKQGIGHSEIHALVQSELGRITQPELKALLTSLLVMPRCEQRSWDYGTNHQTYPCWVVAEHAASNTAFVYCEQGFGPTYPWGLLFITGPMGMDSQWYISLDECLRDSMAWDGPNPPSYAVS